MLYNMANIVNDVWYESDECHCMERSDYSMIAQAKVTRWLVDEEKVSIGWICLFYKLDQYN